MTYSKMKFLIVRLSSLGDIIHSLPLINEIKNNFPDSQIDWLVGKDGYGLLSLIKEINKIYLPQDILLIQKQNYDYVIDVQGLFKSAFLSKLSFGKKIVGFKNSRELSPLFYDLKIDVGNLFITKKHIIHMNLELISSITKKHLSKVKLLIPQISNIENKNIKEIIVKKNKKSLLFSPGTTWKSKMWPMDYWFNLVSKLSKDFQVILCGAEGDLKYISELIINLDSSSIDYKNLIGKSSFSELIYLIQNVDLVLGMDSFALHMASAIKNDFGFPGVVGIYGPTSPLRTGPYNCINNCLFLSEMECIACRKKECPLMHNNCMKNITPDEVAEMIHSTLKNNP